MVKCKLASRYIIEHWANSGLKKADQSTLLIGIATFAFMNELHLYFGLHFSKHRWVIENLLAVGRHFQKTSYEKEVDGEKQVKTSYEKEVDGRNRSIRIAPVSSSDLGRFGSTGYLVNLIAYQLQTLQCRWSN